MCVASVRDVARAPITRCVTLRVCPSCENRETAMCKCSQFAHYHVSVLKELEDKGLEKLRTLQAIEAFSFNYFPPFI